MLANTATLDKKVFSLHDLDVPSVAFVSGNGLCVVVILSGPPVCCVIEHMRRFLFNFGFFPPNNTVVASFARGGYCFPLGVVVTTGRPHCLQC